MRGTASSTISTSAWIAGKVGARHGARPASCSADAEERRAGDAGRRDAEQVLGAGEAPVLHGQPERHAADQQGHGAPADRPERSENVPPPGSRAAASAGPRPPRRARRPSRHSMRFAPPRAVSPCIPIACRGLGANPARRVRALHDPRGRPPSSRLLRRPRHRFRPGGARDDHRAGDGPPERAQVPTPIPPPRAAASASSWRSCSASSCCMTTRSSRASPSHISAASSSSAFLIAVVSFLDDIRDWRFAVKLAAQLVAALAAVASGLYVSVFNLPYFGPVDIGLVRRARRQSRGSCSPPTR